MPLSDYAAPHVLDLHAYVPGTQPSGEGWIKLNTNELPYPCSPAVAQAIMAEMTRLPLYPSPTSAPLRAAIAEHHGLQPEQVIVGNGSDDILNLLVRVFGGQTIDTFPSYSLYPVLVSIQNGQLQSVPFGEDMKLSVDKLAELKGSILFLTTPNAPTGVAFPRDDIGHLCERFDGIVVADEAYADFADRDCRPLMDKHDNLVITRTFSKSYGLAGLRVGYALAHAEVIDLLDRVRDSYNVNRLSQAGALAAFRDQDYLRDVVRKVRRTRDSFRQRCQAHGWFTYPSQSNFIFTRPETRDSRRGPEVAQALFAYLRERKILVRYFPNHPFTAPFLRISIGTEAQMTTLNDAIDQWLQHA
ncbi:MAG: histidinol-phosphate aminotransferase [Puniceicoccaceae bacterium 5H]|nr:MAG: histidinol-phosphate aminotransferase [Puniceicoccaceae bacterium 5H]